MSWQQRRLVSLCWPSLRQCSSRKWLHPVINDEVVGLAMHWCQHQMKPKSR